MGKGNRERLRRDEDVLAKSNNNVKSAKTKSKGVPLWAGNLILAAFGLLLAVVVVWGVITSSGLLLKLSNYASTPNFELSGSQMNYLFKTVYNDFLNQYSSYLSYFGLNTNLSLKDQKSIYTDENNNAMTWFEVFAEQTEDQAKQLLVLCQMAHNEGLAELSEEDVALIEESMTALKEEAAGYSYSLSSYIKAVYGAGVSEKDIRVIMEYQTIASNYYEVLRERLLDGIGEDRVNAYFNEHQNDFLSVDYLTYTIKVTKGTYKAEAEQSEKDKVEKEYTDAKATADEYAGKFEAAKTVDEFIAVLVDYIIAELAEDEFDTQYAEEFKNISISEAHTPEQKEAFKTATFEKLKAALLEVDVLGKNEDKEEEDKKDETEKTALQKAEEKLYSDMLDTYTTTLKGTYTKGGSYVEDDDFSKWLFEDARKANDKKLDKEEAEDKKSYTVGATIVAKEKYKDTTITKNVGHILFTKNVHADPEAKAKEILELYKSGAMTREAFEALGNEHTEDSGVFYENVYEGQMVEEFEDWLFDDARKVGDVEIVETEYGFHIMYFDGNGNEMWYSNVEGTIFNNDYEAWYEAAITTSGVSINSKNINKIDI